MKKIILSEGAVKTMSFEEVLKQFTPMINKAANVAIGKFGTSIEREDMIQEMKLETWKAYEDYNGEYAFSTYLHYKLMKVTGNEAQKITAKKRSGAGTISMNATLSDDDEFSMENFIAKEDHTNENIIAAEMLELIKNSLSEREQAELKCVLYPKEYTATQLSEELGISRQAAHQRVVKLKTKLQKLLIENDYA